MSNIFSQEININTLLTEIGVCSDSKFDYQVSSISDGNLGAPNSVCAYLKGNLPEQHKNQAVLCREEIDGYDCIVVNNPKVILNKIVNFIQSEIGFKKSNNLPIDFSQISVGQHCVIEDDVYIGKGTIIEHNVVLHSGTYIGENCIIRSGSVIGGEGYGFIKQDDGTLVRELFIGNVYIGNNVEVGYNCAIVKGLINNTVIEDGVKLDNLIHIAHDCTINENATLTAGVSLCGHVHIGSGTRLAPNSTIKQRVTIGSDSIIGLGAVVLKNVSDNDVVFGNPAKSLRRRGRK